MSTFVYFLRCSGPKISLSLVLRSYKTGTDFWKNIPRSVSDEKRRRIFQKLMDKRDQKYGDQFLSVPEASSGRGNKGFKEPKMENNHRNTRAKALSKFYMVNISDLISSGALGQDTQLLNFHITKVVTHPSGRYLHVSWVPSNISDNVDDIQTHLNKQAHNIRYQLIAQKNVGSAPEIRFGQDKSLATLLDLERALSQADFGPDYQSAGQDPVFSPRVVLPTKENPPQRNGELFGPSEMTQDILDLDYTHLMNMVRLQPFKKIVDKKGKVAYGEYDAETEKDFYLFLRKRKHNRLHFERKLVTTDFSYCQEEPEQLLTDDYVQEDEDVQGNHFPNES